MLPAVERGRRRLEVHGGAEDLAGDWLDPDQDHDRLQSHGRERGAELSERRFHS